MRFEHHGIGKIWFSNNKTSFLKSMQLAVHLSTCYLVKLEYINQTLTFPYIVTDFCQSLFILYEESHSGHNMAIKILGPL